VSERPLHILVVDDSPSDRLAAVRGLRKGFAPGVRVHEVGTEPEWRQALDTAHFDLAIIDYRLGWTDGLELLRELKARAPAKPVIMLTGTSTEGQALMGAQEGLDDYLTKEPHSYATLPRAVRFALERARQRQALLEAKAFEQQLIGIVSHDLRNPLNVIGLSTELLLRRPGLDEPQRQGLTRIATAADRAKRMIRDLLDLTQARLGGGIAVTRRPLELGPLVTQVSEEVALTSPGRHVQVTHETDTHGVWDADRLGQVVQNLVGNALQHSPPDTPVQVRTHGDAEHLILEVHNTGRPIPPELLPQLFEPMRRGQADDENSSGSLGLGLYIVRQLVVAHGGTIGVASSAEAGTTFTVRLPRAAPPGSG
jgi:signal transduction histidine kinase